MVDWRRPFRRRPKPKPITIEIGPTIGDYHGQAKRDRATIKVMAGLLVEFDMLVANRMPDAHARMMTSERFKRRRAWWGGRSRSHGGCSKYGPEWRLWGPQSDGIDKMETRLGVSPILAERKRGDA